jgi:hypothetical protein
MHPYHPFRISRRMYTPPRKLGKLGKFHPSSERRPGPGKISLSAIDTTCGAYQMRVGGPSPDRPVLSAPAYPPPSVMPQQEPFPFSPLVERCFELVVDISAEQFEEEAAAFMAAVGAALDLSEHKTIEHWEIRIDKPRNGPPKPKATLYNVPTVSRPERSVTGNQSIETVHFTPATENGPAKLKYAQLKPQDGAIMSFGEAKTRLGDILRVLDQGFGSNIIRQTIVAYWNDLIRLDHSFFRAGDCFVLSNALTYCQGIHEVTVPPWSLSMNCEVPSRPKAVLHLNINVERKASIPVWVTLAYEGEMSAHGVSSSDCLAELDTAHTVIYEKFLSILTPEALQYCQNGTVNDPTTQP